MGFDPFAIGDNNTKMTILSILDRLGPISAKKMHSELRKEGISISYQAAHKALNKMLDKGIIIYEDRNFSVNPKWVSNMRIFINQLEKEPNSLKEIFSRLDSGKTVSFTASSDIEMGYFVLDFTYYFSRRYSSAVSLNLLFMWTILPLNDKQYKMFKDILKRCSMYVTSKEDSTYDGIMKRHWEKAGAKVAIGVPDCASNCDVIVIGDYIINIFWNPEHLKRNIEFNRTIIDEKSLDYDGFYKMLSAPTRMEFIIVKNKAVAESIRNKTLGYFK